MEIKAHFICSNVDKPKNGDSGLHFRFLAIPEEPKVEEPEEEPEEPKEPEAPKEEDKKTGKGKNKKEAKEESSEESKEEAEEAKEEAPETDGMPLGQSFELFPKFPNREILKAGKKYLVTISEITDEEPIAAEE